MHPNIQYEYEATDAGLYKMCIMLTKMAFNDKYQRIKTKVKFSAEFHRSKSIGIPLGFISLLIIKVEEFKRKKKSLCLEIVK